jgi:nucleotide-binding universal stress UspA family protein
MTRLPITVGTDGSKPSLRAIDWAAREAAARGLPLRIVSVPELPARMCAHHARALSSAAERAAAQQPGLAIDTRLLPGHPAQVLVQSSTDAAMLVVGSWGAGTLSTRFLGSVSQNVAAQAGCPVVVVREQATQARREIVVGIGDLDRAGRALEFAFEEAALRDAAVVAVHAWSWYLPTTGRLASMDPTERAAVPTCCLSPDISDQLGDTVGGWRDRYPGVTAEVQLPRGLPGRALTAASTRADLVVLGRWPTQRPSPGVRSVTHTVLHHAHAPVAVTAPDLVPG